MTEMPLQDAIAEVSDSGPWDDEAFTIGPYSLRDAAACVLNAVASGDLIPKADADLAVALAYQRAADEAGNFSTSQHVAHSIREGVFPEQTDIRCAIQDAILALADADAQALMEPSSAPETSAELEARICTCGAGHGSLEGHVDWCDWLAYLALPLAPAEPLAEVERLRAERDGARKANREMVLEVLAASGQAQDAWEAQKAAEAEVARLRDALAEIADGNPTIDSPEADAANSAAIARAALTTPEKDTP